MNSKPEYLKFQKAAIRKQTPLHIWNPQEKVIPNKRKGRKKVSKKEMYQSYDDEQEEHLDHGSVDEYDESYCH